MNASAALAFTGAVLLAGCGFRLLDRRRPARSRGGGRRHSGLAGRALSNGGSRGGGRRHFDPAGTTFPGTGVRGRVRQGFGPAGVTVPSRGSRRFARRAAVARGAARPAWPRGAPTAATLGVGALGIAATAAALGATWAGAALAGAAPPFAALLGLGWRRLRARRVTKLRLAAQAAAAPAVVDLLAACLAAGLNGHLALLRIAERCPAALQPEFRLVAADLRVGRSPAAALRAAAERTGLAELRAAAGALQAAERWGAPPAEALAARAEALRSRLRLEAEAAAGRAAVRLTFPLVLCFLPAFLLLTVVPLVAGAIRALGI